MCKEPKNKHTHTGTYTDTPEIAGQKYPACSHHTHILLCFSGSRNGVVDNGDVASLLVGPLCALDTHGFQQHLLPLLGVGEVVQVQVPTKTVEAESGDGRGWESAGSG